MSAIATLSLSTGQAVAPDIAEAVLASPEIEAAGDGLFGDESSQTFKSKWAVAREWAAARFRDPAQTRTAHRSCPGHPVSPLAAETIVKARRSAVHRDFRDFRGERK
jgi:hypothetical protein